MQTIYAYSYNPSIATGTNTTKTVWRMAYQQPILLYKGTANTIKLIVFNNNQKVVDLTNYDVQVQIVDKDTQEHYVTRTATISSPATGIAQITFTEPDLRNLQHRFYHIIARLMPPNDGSTVINGEILYLDDNYGAFTPVTIEDAWNFQPTNISVTDGSSSITFTGIGETPNSLAGFGNYYVRVNDAEDSLEFVAAVSPSLEAVTNVMPAANNTYYVGNSALRWHSMFMGNATMGNISIAGSTVNSAVSNLKLNVDNYSLTMTDTGNIGSGVGSRLLYKDNNDASEIKFELWYGDGSPGDPLGQHSLDIIAGDDASYVELGSHDENTWMGVDAQGAFIHVDWQNRQDLRWRFATDGALYIPDNGYISDNTSTVSIIFNDNNITFSTHDPDGSTIHFHSMEENGDFLLDGNFRSIGNGLHDLGAPNNRFRHLYFNENSTIYLGNTYIKTNVTGDVIVTTNVDTVPHETIFALNGDLLTGNILPKANLAYSLGDATHQWSDLYVSNTTIYLGGIPLSVDATGNLLVNGNAVTGGGAANTGNVTFSVATLSTSGTNQDMTLDPNGSGNVKVQGRLQITGNLDLLNTNFTGTYPYWSFVQPNTDTLKLRTNISDADVNTDVITIDRTTQAVTMHGNAIMGNVTASRFISNVATGTAPFTVTSTTQVANLNAATAGSATSAGTVTTAAQPNITSLGTLTGLTVSGVTSLGPVGNVQITGGSNGQYLSTNGSGVLTWATVSGAADTGNISFSNTTISSVNTNADIVIDPNGTGNVNINGQMIFDSGLQISTMGEITHAGGSASLRSGPSHVLISSNVDTAGYDWEFGADGILTIPKDIVGSGTNDLVVQNTAAGYAYLELPLNASANPVYLGNQEATGVVGILAGAFGSSKEWRFDHTGTLTIPDGGGIDLGQMVAYGSTIATTVTNQDLTLDPNGAGAVVMTSGKIALGNSQSEIISVANSAGDGSGLTTLKLIPDQSAIGGDQFIIIDPTGGEPGHIHLRAGGTQDASAADLYLGGELTCVRVSDISGFVTVRTTNIGDPNITMNWRFETDGNLYFPGIGNNKIGESEPGLVVSSDYAVALQSNNGGVSKEWLFNTNGSLTFPDGSSQVTAFDLDNIDISGNTISSINSNGDINLDPNGTGEINLNVNSHVWTVRNDGKFYKNGMYLDGVNARLATEDNNTLSIYGGYDVHIRSYDPATLTEHFWEFKVDGSTSFPGDIIVGGNITIQGNTTVVNTSDLTVEDSIINLHSQANLAAWTEDDGRDIGVAFHHYKSGTDKHAYLVWQNDTTHLEYYSDGTESAGVISGTLGTIHANIFSANVATGAAPFIVKSTTQVANLNAATAGTAGTVTTASQPNITSLGALTALTVSGTVDTTSSANVSLGAVGNIKITGGTNGYVLSTDGTGNLSWVAQSGGGASTGNITFSTATISTVGTNENITLDPNGTGNVSVVGGMTVTANITSPILTSNIATGTAPFVVTSTTQVANLNVAQAGQLINGNSNVTITANSNVSVFVNGNATARAVFTSTGANIAGTANITGAVSMLSTLNVSANANVGNIGAATAVITTAANVPLIQNSTSNITIASASNVTISSAGVANVFTVSATGANIAGTVNATGNANLANLYNTGTLTSTGNITTTGLGGNISGANVISANTITLSSNIILSTTRTPSTAVGATGDSTGMFAWDGSYIYICTANYDGSTVIWRRASANSW